MSSQSDQPLPQYDHASGEAGRIETRRGKAARRDPEKRRLQNQQAQKKYREKRRQRLQELEDLAASITADISDVVGLHENQQESQRVQALPPVEHAEKPSPRHTGCSMDIWPMGSWDMVTTSEAATSLTTAATTVDPRLLVSNRSQQWTLSFFDCGCRVPHIEIRPTSDRTRNSLRAVAAINVLPDPYLNIIRVERMCLIQAMKANCLQIGITDTAFCADDSISPFFRATNTIGENASLVRTVQGIFRTVRPDLRPTERQITSVHHPFVDILPFPVLRDNLIRCIDNSSIDEDEFFYDALNGLVCWGSAGASRRDNNGIGSGTPWDVRSWEAREWFIQKWWYIIGGEEGELVRQSRWWRALRGDDDSGRMDSLR